MIIIGERLNSSIKRTYAAMEAGDFSFLAQSAKEQEEAGASYIDINTAMLGEREAEVMSSVVKAVLPAVSCGICLDSPSPRVIERASELIGKGRLMVNSVGDDERLSALLNIILEKDARVIVMPKRGRKLESAKNAVARLTSAGVPACNIIVDCVTEAVSVNAQAALEAISFIRVIKSEIPGVHALTGLSNISFGLPCRTGVNAAFLTLALEAGADAMIADMTDDRLYCAYFASNALLGRDEYCMDYISAARARALR